MAGNILWSGYLSTFTDRLTTELNSLANGSASALSAEIDNTTNKYRFADIDLHLASLTPTGSPYVAVYLVPCVDGTNYPTFDTGASPGLGNNNYLVASFALKAAAGAFDATLTGILLPPGKFKWGIRNNAGVAFAASGNTFSDRYYSEAYT